MSKIDKIRFIPNYDLRKTIEFFNLVEKLDTHQILQYSLINQLPLDCEDAEGENMIHKVININSSKATEHAKLNVVKFLVQNNVNPNKPNKNNQLPLHLACKMQLELIVEYLLSINVDSNYKDNLGLTPFHYLLTGYIKNIEMNDEILDFIQPTEKKDTKQQEIINEIKDSLLKIIDEMIEKNLPDFKIFSTIKETLKNIVYENPEIEIKIQKSLVDIQSSTQQSDINRLIETSKHAIYKFIIEKFNNLPNIDNLVIHQKEEHSWTPIDESKQAILKNSNIKKSIKEDMIDLGDQTDKLKNDFILIDEIDNTCNKNTMNNIFSDYIDNLKFENFNREDFMIIGGQINYSEINDKLRYEYAIDNASDIIDFDNLRYAAGPRNIEIYFNDDGIGIDLNNGDYYKNQLVNLLELGSLTKQIFYLLASSIIPYEDIDPRKGIQNMDDNILDTFDDFIGYFGLNGIYIEANWIFLRDHLNPGDLNNLRLNILDARGNPIGDPNNNIYKDYYYYIKLGVTAIINPENFSDLVIPDARQNIFFNKWYNKYLKTNDISSWIYNMWCDINCKISDNNLNCKVDNKLIMLMAGLKCQKSNIIQGIINAYKPQLIQFIFTTNPTNNNIKIIKWLIVLLSNNINNNFIDIIFNDDNNLDFLENLPIDRNSSLYKLINLYYLFLIDGNYYNDQYYKKFYKENDTPNSVFSKMILHIYDKMEQKPLKTTILDTIYCINKYNINIDDLKKIYTFHFALYLVGHNITNISSDLLPSYYSLYNYYFDNNNNRQYNIIIAHMLGLFYEGEILICDNFPTFNNAIRYNKKNYYLSVDITDLRNIHSNNYHNMIPNNRNLPLPLNFIIKKNIRTAAILPLNPYEKYYGYYNCDRTYKAPTKYGYFKLQLKRIYEYQDFINKKLSNIDGIGHHIKNLLAGKTSNLKKLYTKDYPLLVVYCKLLNNFIENLNKIDEKINIKEYNYKKLANILNKINSNYYLYYYIFSKDILKLSKFNYYQIPIDELSPFNYYSHDTSYMLNIIKENPIDPPQLRITSTIPINDNPKKRHFGTLNQSLGNYNDMLNDFINNKFSVVIEEENTFYSQLKSQKVPPSLYNSLSELYQYSMIKLLINLLNYIKTNNPDNILSNVDKLLEKLNINISDIDTSKYYILAEIIQEIIKGKIIFEIKNNIIEKYKKLLGLTIRSFDENLFILDQSKIEINLDKIKLSIEELLELKEKDYINLYSLVVQPIKNDNIFILYPNDLTNINKLVTNFGIKINTNIIKLLLKNSSSPFTPNNDGYAAIYSVIKNYNYPIIKKLRELNIDFRNFNYENSPINFIKNENINNLNKILENYKITDPVNILLNKIDGYLYNDVKLFLSNNISFGNNILLYLEESFNLSSYLVLQYLGEHLMNININFSLNNVQELCNMCNINIVDINKNYFSENLGSLNIFNNINQIIINNELKKVGELYNKTKKELKSYRQTIEKLEKSGNTQLADKIKNSSQYNNTLDERKKLKTERDILANFSTSGILLKNHSISDNKIIQRYNKLGIDNGIIIYAWSQFLNKPIENNYNLIIIFLLIKQKELINNLNLTNIEELNKIKNGMEHISILCEDYFNKPKYTDDNRPLRFISDMLLYITKLVIGNGIEMMIRRILFTYYRKHSISDISRITDFIDYIFDKKVEYNKSIKELLYDVLCPNLVKCGSLIFENKAEERSMETLTINSELSSFFHYFNNFTELSDEVKLIFRKELLNYFDEVSSKTILLWHINAENIFKFMINNYRCLETLISL